MNAAYDLEQRLLEYSARIIRLVERLPNSRAGNHVAGQLLRSGTSPLPNHGEAQAAESANDFMHKLKICLKELKETHIALQIVSRKSLVEDFKVVDKSINECKELISIFVKSIETAKENNKNTPA